MLLVTAAAFLLARRLVRGKYGRAFSVVRANEAVAMSMGISPYRTKVLSFTIASHLRRGQRLPLPRGRAVHLARDA